MKRKIFLVIWLQILLLSIIGTNSLAIISLNHGVNDHIDPSITQSSDSHKAPLETLIMINVVAGEQFKPTFNPVLDSYNILSLPFDTLVEVNPVTGEIIPTLAKQWVVTNDSKHWTFYLRENIKCHDNSIINASAVKAVFDTIIDENNLGYNPDGLPDYYSMPLESVEILSENTIRINFNESYSPFIRIQAARIRIPSLTSYPDVYFGEPLLSRTEGYWPIGSGPYVLQNITDEGNYFNYTFTRFQNHFRGLAPFESVQYHLYFNPTYARDALIAQKGHTGPFMPSILNKTKYPDFNNTGYWQAFPHPRGIDLAFLNQNRSEPLKDRKVRQALNYAINKSAYIEFIENSFFLQLYHSKNFIPGSTLESNDNSPRYPYNLSLADELLNQAGYERKEDGYRNFSLFVNGVSWYREEITFLVSYLEAIGIHCTTPFSNPDWDWYHDFYEGNYDVYVGFISSEGDISFNAYSYLNSDGGENPGKISNQSLDVFTSLGMQTPVPQEKIYYAKKAEEIAQDYIPHILLADGDDKYLKAKSVASYVWLDDLPEHGIYFNYTDTEITSFKKIEGVEIKNQSIYFPNTNGILSSKDLLNVTTEISGELSSFVPNQDQFGKYFKIAVDNKTIEYSLRLYYDVDDFESLSSGSLSLFQWYESRQEWMELSPVSENLSLQYVEIKASGNVILKFGKKIIEITYKYLPGVTIITGLLVTIAAVTIFYNNKFTNYFKGRYDLK